jgi:hypothetical protein
MISPDRVLDPLAGRYGKELHERRKLRRYLCSELGANLVAPEGLIAGMSHGFQLR